MNMYQFRQLSHEELHETWDRFNRLLHHCPNYWLDLQTLMYRFQEGMLMETRNRINDATNGRWMLLSSEEKKELIEIFADDELGICSSDRRQGLNQVETKSSKEEDELKKLREEVERLRKKAIQNAKASSQWKEVVKVVEREEAQEEEDEELYYMGYQGYGNRDNYDGNRGNFGGLEETLLVNRSFDERIAKVTHNIDVAIKAQESRHGNVEGRMHTIEHQVGQLADTICNPREQVNVIKLLGKEGREEELSEKDEESTVMEVIARDGNKKLTKKVEESDDDLIMGR